MKKISFLIVMVLVAITTGCDWEFRPGGRVYESIPVIYNDGNYNWYNYGYGWYVTEY